MSDLRAVRQVTHLFPIFLGLRLLPIGLWFLAVAIPAPEPFPSGPLKVLLVVAVLAVWPIDRWYRRRFGTVEPERLRLGRNAAILLGLTAAYLALGFGAAVMELRPLVLLLVLILFGTAVLFALPRLSADGRLVAGLVLAVAGACGVLMVALTRDPASLGALGGLFSLSIGAVLCLAGILEHRSLARAIARLGENGAD